MWYDEAFTEALMIAREVGNPAEISTALDFLATFTVEVGDHREARPLFEESLDFARQANDIGLVGSIFAVLAK